MHDDQADEVTARFDEAGVCTWSSDPAIIPVGARIEQSQSVIEKDAALAQLVNVLTGTPRTGKEVAIGLCEIDHAPAGGFDDEVIGVVGATARSVLRHGDVVARWDAGRLLILMRGVHHLRGAMRVANKARVAVEVGGVGHTVSVGVTMVIHGESTEAVLARATEALDDARKLTSNAVSSSPRI